MRFTRTSDLELVRALIAAPGSFDTATDDTSPGAAEFTPNPHPAIWYVVAADEQGTIGLYSLIPHSAVCWEIHATRVWGSRAAAAARSLPGWVFSRSSCRRIVAAIPATNTAAIRGARRAGYLEYGRNPRSFLKGGELVDQILLGISPEDI